MKRLLSILVCAIMLISFSACDSSERYTDMPINGEMAFHDIIFTIPDDFVSDTTQSSEDFWVFERGFYSEYFFISRKDNDGNAYETIAGYSNFINQSGGTATVGEFIGKDAVLCSYTKDGLYCQELMFEYGDSIYDITLRNGDSEMMGGIMDSVKLLKIEEATEESTD